MEKHPFEPLRFSILWRILWHAFEQRNRLFLQQSKLILESCTEVGIGIFLER